MNLPRLLHLWQIKRRWLHLSISLYAPDRASLLTISFGAGLGRIEASGVDIRTADFIANGLSNFQRPIDGLNNKRELRAILDSSLHILTRFFDFDADPIAPRLIGLSMPVEYTALVGVAGIISAINAAVASQASDWVVIPVSPGRKTVDLLALFNGAVFATVEAKGTLNQSYINGRVTELKLQKKSARARKAVEPVLGGVTCIDGLQEPSVTICDPPGEGFSGDIRKEQLLARLTYYRNVLATFSSSYLLQALSQRISDISRLTNYVELDGAALRSRSGAEMVIPPSLEAPVREMNLDVFGDFFVGAENRLLFVGLRRRIVEILLSQNFDDILRYTDDDPVEFGEGVREIKAFLDNNTVRRLNSDGAAEKKGGRVQTTLRGEIVTTTAGLALGEFKTAAEE